MKFVFIRSYDSQHPMGFLRMSANKGSTAIHHNNVAPPYSVSYLRRQVSKGKSGWTPAFAGVTTWDGVSAGDCHPECNEGSRAMETDSSRTLRMTIPTAGFSLVELSIVLVILGLLVGGVLTGKSLIEAAELRSVSTELAAYNTAIQTFKEKYLALPGDMNNATRFWGDNTSLCSDGVATNNGTPGTCNGNQNNFFELAPAANQAGERFMFWQQLSLAELIQGNYTGAAGALGTGNNAISNVNSPASAFNGATWGLESGEINFVYPITFYEPFPTNSYYTLSYGNIFEFGLAGGTSGVGDADGKIMTAEQARRIDYKSDDGMPAKGKIIARYWNNQCASADDGTSASDDFNASYRVTDTSIQCSLVFREMF
jgi:prepilin-type N-terminal cleavage/methylation domain-containing protein